MVGAPRISLRILTQRPGMLLACHRPGWWSPVVIGAGMFFWLGMLAGIGLGGPWVVNGIAGLIGLGCLAIGPLMALHIEWLSIDLNRGWVHWRCRAPYSEQQDSFSPQRLDSIRCVRHGLAPRGLHWATLELRMDHPRLRVIRLGWWLNDAHVETAARRAAAALRLPWFDVAGRQHALVEPDAPGRTGVTSTGAIGQITNDFGAPPPPEVELLITGSCTSRNPLLLMPNFSRLQHGYGMLLFYALVWNLWGWSCLVYEAIHFGPPTQWDDEQMLVIGLLLGVGLAGLAMLHAALMRLLGRQALRWNGHAWQMTRRWLGINWGWRTLELQPGAWLRRVDPPCHDAGLWLPTERGDVQLGHELSSEGLAWLERSLLTPPILETSTQALEAEALG